MIFKEAPFRHPTGHLRNTVSKRSVSELVATSGSIDDELWLVLEYYSEVNDVGLKFLENNIGIKDKNIRKKVFSNFQAYIRQAKNYFNSAKTLPAKSAGLLYYYSFLNLAKAAIILKNPQTAGRKINHGLSYVFNDKYSDMNKEKVVLTTDKGVFQYFYNWYYGFDINLKTFSIKNLFSYCTDISYQCMISGIHKNKILNCLYASVVQKDNKESWGIIGIPSATLLLNYPSSFKKFVNSYEKIIEIPQHWGREIFSLSALELSKYTFFQSTKITKWISDNVPNLYANIDEVVECFGSYLQSYMYKEGCDFQIALPYSKPKQVSIDETVSIYIIMFYISNLVRYNPGYLEHILNKKESWIIESFVKSCPTTFLRNMVSRIINTDFILETR